MNTQDIAFNVREFRKKRKITLGEMAALTGVTKGCLSQVENRRALPSVPLLYRLAEGLGVTPAELVQRKAPDPACVFTPAGHGNAHPTASSMWLWLELARNKQVKLMNPRLLEIPARIVLKSGGTRTDQFFYGVEGQVHVALNHEVFIVAPGDSIYFNGHVAYSVENRADTLAKLLVIHAVPVAARSAV
jgi:transcriptional regulator with XRE-family HTH domain